MVDDEALPPLRTTPIRSQRRRTSSTMTHSLKPLRLSSLESQPGRARSRVPRRQNLSRRLLNQLPSLRPWTQGLLKKLRVRRSSLLLRSTSVRRSTSLPTQCRLRTARRQRLVLHQLWQKPRITSKQPRFTKFRRGLRKIQFRLTSSRFRLHMSPPRYTPSQHLLPKTRLQLPNTRLRVRTSLRRLRKNPFSSRRKLSTWIPRRVDRFPPGPMRQAH
jgi:hypothetical protein